MGKEYEMSIGLLCQDLTKTCKHFSMLSQYDPGYYLGAGFEGLASPFVGKAPHCIGSMRAMFFWGVCSNKRPGGAHPSIFVAFPFISIAHSQRGHDCHDVTQHKRQKL